MMDQLYELGVVSNGEGAQERQILMTEEQWEIMWESKKFKKPSVPTENIDEEIKMERYAEKDKKAAIIYTSTHHGNTKKLIDAIVAKHEVTLIDATKETKADLNEFDIIGIASGIYFGNFHKSIISFVEDNLPDEKKVFLMSTYGNATGEKEIRSVLKAKKAEIAGSYGCKGYDTFGPFKLVGGIAKGHPTEEELQGTVNFFEGLLT